MGKNKRIHKNTNVFKVKIRSTKLKTKAQKIFTNLKKLDPKGNKKSNKNKTINMDQILNKLDRDLQAYNSKAKLDATSIQMESIKINKGNISPKKKTMSPQTDIAVSMVEQMQL